MKTIKIKFSGMGGKFDEENNFFVRTLKKRYNVVLSNNPDYLIYSVNSNDYLNYDCVRIFYTAENVVPDFNLCDYGIGFHHMTFEDRYFRYPLYLVEDFNAYDGDDYGDDLRCALNKHNVSSNPTEKKEFCSFVYSNSDAAECRRLLFERLSEYKEVNSGGRYLNNIGGPVINKREFQRKHKFVIAFENSSTSGYTTEKIVHAFAAESIPIYWGDPRISETFNEKAFVNCHEYGLNSEGNENAIRRIVDRVIEIDNDERLYSMMINTPAFIDSNSINKCKNEFENFLFYIFDQDTSEAYRRNRLLWGQRYERKQRIGEKVYWSLRKLIPLRDIIKNFKK